MPDKPDHPTDAGKLIRDHRRQWRDCLYVYPVISRRSKGMSIGVNLSPDKRCNFSCVYCQIDRTIERNLHTVDIDKLRDELRLAMRVATSGEIWSEERFAETPAELRRVNDIAFSGDGEPTRLATFDEAVQAASDIRDEFAQTDTSIIVITNSTCLDSPQFTRALPILDAGKSDIWAKLDAGTEERFAAINRPAAGITLAKVVGDIANIAKDRPITIQSLLFSMDGEKPAPGEIDAYCGRLRDILSAAGPQAIKLLQVHTVARSPMECFVATLADSDLDAIAATIHAQVPGIHMETYYGQDVKPQGM